MRVLLRYKTPGNRMRLLRAPHRSQHVSIKVSADACFGRWQRSRELLSSCLHGVIFGAILLFVFPAWARSLPRPKLRSLMWLFRFSGSEGLCVVPFICMVRPANTIKTGISTGQISALAC